MLWDSGVLLCLLLAGCLFSCVGHPRGVSLGGLPEHNTPVGETYTREIYSHTVLEPRSPKLGCQQGRFLAVALREDPFCVSRLAFGSCWQSLGFLGLWLPQFSLRLHRHMAFSLVCLCVHSSVFSYKDTNLYDLILI